MKPVTTVFFIISMMLALSGALWIKETLNIIICYAAALLFLLLAGISLKI